MAAACDVAAEAFVAVATAVVVAVVACPPQAARASDAAAADSEPNTARRVMSDGRPTICASYSSEAIGAGVARSSIQPCSSRPVASSPHAESVVRHDARSNLADAPRLPHGGAVLTQTVAAGLDEAGEPVIQQALELGDARLLRRIVGEVTALIRIV